MKQVMEDASILKAKGFISAFMYTGEPEFVSLSDTDPTYGYFKLPKEIAQEMHVKNLIVSYASQFMAKRMAPGTSWGAGIGYLELGTGVGTGTTQSPQAEDPSYKALRVPLIRSAITSWTYLDANGNATTADSNVIQLTTTFDETQANAGIVEMGLFGGDATTTLGSGHMFNYKTFPVWNKDSTMKLTVVWKLTF